MGIELSLDQMIRLYQLATLGKLINGLVHNLNGPLQNLSIDMEMILHTLKARKHQDVESLDHFKERLLRMEKEFENINNLVRATTLRADQDDSWLEQMHLGHYLEQELSFLNADLYFKHQVQKKIEIDQRLPPLSTMPKHLPQALSWFIHLVLEELEKEKIKEFGLKASAGQAGPQVVLTLEGKECSKTFLNQLNQDLPSNESFKTNSEALDLSIVLTLLKTNGVELEIKSEPHQCMIILNLGLLM